jgi:lipoic acid synthetase
MDLVVESYPLLAYRQAYARQLQLVELLRGDPAMPDHCLMLEHPPVFTLGRNGSLHHIGVSEGFLEDLEIELVRIERGGEVTYHGPGQIVCYPIVNLRRSGLTVTAFIGCLEGAMIDAAAAHGLDAGRDARNRGVWSNGKKLGSVGIAIRHGITFHGLALNVTTDLDPFAWISPCGLSQVTMTTLQQETGRSVAVDAVRQSLIEALAERLGRRVDHAAVPAVPSAAEPASLPRAAKPKWLRKPLPPGGAYEKTRRLINRERLQTVCREARCPNQFECYGNGTATFMIMGQTCTRNCRFCAVGHGVPEPLDAGEPERIAGAVVEMGLDHVVLTSVTRDDCADGGAGHFVATIEAIRDRRPHLPVEILIPDLQGDQAALQLICRAHPAVVNHNIETVPRLYAVVRPQADYHRSLTLLRRVKQATPNIVVKSGLMLGLGETADEVLLTLREIRETGCELLTLGQYLQPTRGHLPVQRFVEPSEFDEFKRLALEIGFLGVASGPHVRSSFQAGRLFRQIAQLSPV